MINFMEIYEEHNFNMLEEKLNLEFEDKELIVKAFIHPSFCSINNLNYQRLEFLGDAVLQVVMSDFMYRTMTNEKEGEMSKMRAKLVSEFSLSYIVRKNGFDKFILVGKSVINDGGEFSDSFVADVFESLVAAIYLDSGYRNAEEFIKKFLIEERENILKNEHTKDYKTQLQEKLQVNGSIDIKYTTEKIEEGFRATVMLEGVAIGNGIGKSKKLAEQQSAKHALETML